MRVCSDSSELTSMRDRRGFVMDEVVGGPFIATCDFWNITLISTYHCISRTAMHDSKQHILQNAEWRRCQPLHVQVTNTSRDSGMGHRLLGMYAICPHSMDLLFFFPTSSLHPEY